MNQPGATVMSHPLDRRARRQLASRLLRRRGLLAADVRGSVHGRMPAECEPLVLDLVDGLAAAVELGSIDGFVHHARETATICEARGTSRAALDRILAGLGDRLVARVPGDDAGLARACVDSARLAVQAGGFTARGRVPRRRPPLARERELFTEAALAARWQTAYAIVARALAAGHGRLDVYADLVAESLYDVGRRWARAEITVADQHVATAVAEFVLSRLYTQLTPDPRPHGPAVVACAPTEAHQTGAHVVADALELDGWDVRFLGANASPREVARAVEASGASLVAVSASLLPTAARAARLIEDLRERLVGNVPRIVVGGCILRAVPELWRALGADAFAADVRGAAGAARGAAA